MAKRIMAVLIVLTIILLSPGCKKDEEGKTKLLLPFTVDQVDYVEMYHYSNDSADVQMKVITEADDFRSLYSALNRISVEVLPEKPSSDAKITSFRFHLSNCSEELFDLIYYCYGC